MTVDVMVGFKRITDELRVGFDVYHPLYSFSGLVSFVPLKKNTWMPLGTFEMVWVI